MCHTQIMKPPGGLSKNNGSFSPNHPLNNRGFPLFSPSILGVLPLFLEETSILPLGFGTIINHPFWGTWMIHDPWSRSRVSSWVGHGGAGCFFEIEVMIRMGLFNGFITGGFWLQKKRPKILLENHWFFFVWNSWFTSSVTFSKIGCECHAIFL